jgi:crotonobetainyl-CoA:carnitine CoA-transferase CaiB-like acyl-CoA transferase
MPERVSAWSVYDAFDTSDGASIFIAVTSDGQWRRFGEAFGLDALAADTTLATNNARIQQRSRFIPVIRRRVAELTLADAEALCDGARVPFARVSRPEALFTDPHLRATGGLLATELPSGVRAELPRVPIRIEGYDFGLRRQPPTVGEHTSEILAELGYGADEVAALTASGAVAVGLPRRDARGRHPVEEPAG